MFAEGKGKEQRLPLVMEALAFAKEPRVTAADFGAGIEREKNIIALFRVCTNGDVRERSVAEINIVLDDHPRKNGLASMYGD